MPHSHYRRYVLQLEVILCGGTVPGLPHFIQVVYTTSGWPLIGHSFLTISNSRMTVLQMLVTEKQPLLTSTYRRQLSDKRSEMSTSTHLMSPYCSERRPNHNFMYTVDHTSGYHSY